MRRAPENTLASLRAASELGADGFSYDLRACATGELVLLADATLERTTDAKGLVAHRTLPELYGVDAGSAFDPGFAGEPVPLVEEALSLVGARPGEPPQHVAWLREAGLVGALVRAIGGAGRARSIRVASDRRPTCIEARDAGLDAMLVAREATEDVYRFARDERPTAVAMPMDAWRSEVGSRAWPTECWGLGVDDPGDLLEACRRPLNGILTREPERALGARALAFLTPEDAGAEHPIGAPLLEVNPSESLGGQGEWCGRWERAVRVQNPFAFPVRVAVDLLVRRGAFESAGLPGGVALEPGQAADVPFTLSGGSWSPGGDPVLVAYLEWDPGPGRPGEHLVLDVPLVRVRELSLGEGTRRVPLLRERWGDPPASMTVRRRRRELMVRIENPGGLEDARILAALDGEHVEGGAAVRLLLPEDAGERAGGVPFSVGIVGRGPGGASRLRRWAGGIPDDGDSGAPGRLRLARA